MGNKNGSTIDNIVSLMSFNFFVLLRSILSILSIASAIFHFDLANLDKLNIVCYHKQLPLKILANLLIGEATIRRASSLDIADI